VGPAAEVEAVKASGRLLEPVPEQKSKHKSMRKKKQIHRNSKAKKNIPHKRVEHQQLWCSYRVISSYNFSYTKSDEKL